MTSPTAPEQQKFVGLPLMVVSPVDLGRLLREIEMIDNALLQQELQKHEPKLPKTSKMMDATISLNRLNLLEKAQRDRLRDFLAAVKERAPLLHMSFSADPSEAFIEKLMDWLRKNVHPLVLLTIGLQPNIGAGAIVRTTNKYFDFSLAANFSKNRELLMSKLQETTRPAVSAQAAVTEPVEAPA
jgi:F0F1-type ATP synthase delta subunit